MAENARKPRKNINVPCLVLAIVFCLALIASICTYFYAASGTEIFTESGLWRHAAEQPHHGGR